MVLAVNPLIDDDGLADFSTMYNAGQIAVGAKRVFPDRQYLWPIPTRDMELCPNLGITMDINFLRKS